MFMEAWKRLTPFQIIALGFALTILLGGLMLSMPFCHAQGVWVQPMDAFFTSVSAVCVTGLVTVTTATSWSMAGKIVLLILIQIGGLGFTSLFMLIMVQMGRKVTLRARLNLQASFNMENISGIVRMLLLVARVTLLVEGLGALLLAAFFRHEGIAWGKAIFWGIFHSVSAFCNAGFDLVGDEGFIPYSGSAFLCAVIGILIILGGIGFTVWYDCLMKAKARLAPSVKHSYRLSTHTKLALLSTLSLILFGAVYFFAAEYANPDTLGGMPVGKKVLAAFFQSITLRTAGFFTIPQGELREGSKLVGSILMMVGGSPGGTAGGMKTVTVAVLLISSWRALRGDGRLNVFGRSVPVHALQKALTVAVTMISLWFVGAMVLAVTEAGTSFAYSATNILYEIASALGTVGVSAGMTPFLSPAGKLVLMLCMYIGRIGPITLALSVAHRTYDASERILYPPEDVLIG